MASERFDEDDLLRYHWIMRANEPKEYDVHRRLKESFRLGTIPAGLDPVKQYVASLKETSYVFRELSDPENGFNGIDSKLAAGIRELVVGLHRLRNIATFMPLLMAARIACVDVPHQFRDILRQCEAYAFRVYKVGNRRADAGLSTFSWYAKQMFDMRGRSTADISKTGQDIVRDIRGLMEYYSNAEEFDFNLSKRDFASWLETYEIKYLLYELEKSKCLEQGESPPLWDDIEKKTTIEHVWPRNPRDYDSWPEDRQAEHFASVNRLGNLTLTFWNPELSNRDFAEKQVMYRDSNLIIQRELAKLITWDKKTIDDRTRDMVLFSLGRWSS